MGSKKGEGGHYLPDNPSVTAFAVTAPFTQGSLCPLRRGRADEYPQGAGRICNAPSSRTAALGIGPYKHNLAHGGKTIKRMPCSSLCPLCKKETRQKPCLFWSG